MKSPKILTLSICSLYCCMAFGGCGLTGSTPSTPTLPQSAKSASFLFGSTLLPQFPAASFTPSVSPTSSHTPTLEATETPLVSATFTELPPTDTVVPPTQTPLPSPTNRPTLPTATPVPPTETPTPPISIFRDTHLLIFASQIPNTTVTYLNLFDENLGTIQRIAQIEGAIYYSSMRFDGAYIVFEGCYAQTCTIYRVNRDGSDLRALTGRISSRIARWSPDGEWISFSQKTGSGDEDYDLFLMRPDGSEVRRLTYGPPKSHAASWSPDGKHLTFQRGPSQEEQIFVMELNTLNTWQISNCNPGCVSPVWSPDGAWIAYYSLPLETSQIFIMSAKGGNIRQITFDSRPSYAPSWSASGDALIFHRRENGRRAIWQIEISSGYEEVVVANDQNNQNPSRWLAR